MSIKKASQIVVERIKEINENSESVEYEKLFDEYFDDVNVTDVGQFKIVILWSVEDWVLFLPYIAAPIYRDNLNIYVQLLQCVVEKNILKIDNEFDYHYLCMRWWLEGVRPLQTSLKSVMQRSKLSQSPVPFHIDVLKNKDANLLYTCISCELNLCCQLNEMNLNKCSDMGVGKKGKHCFPGAGIHLCSKHAGYILDIGRNRYGINEIYKLGDGRTVLSLPVLKRIKDLKIGNVYFYNTSHKVLFNNMQQDKTYVKIGT